MSTNARPHEPDAGSLLSLFDGWDGHNLALVRALRPLTAEQLAFRPAPRLRSVGETARHVADGRLDWWRRMLGDDHELVRPTLGRRRNEPIEAEAETLVEWLNETWTMIEKTLRAWTTDDLRRSYHQPYQGRTWVVPYQWVMFRILAHDTHHGGEIALALGLQGVSIPDLGGRSRNGAQGSVGFPSQPHPSEQGTGTKEPPKPVFLVACSLETPP
jgi:uncharacterized damage-inducible protein DinB